MVPEDDSEGLIKEDGRVGGTENFLVKWEKGGNLATVVEDILGSGQLHIILERVEVEPAEVIAVDFTPPFVALLDPTLWDSYARWMACSSLDSGEDSTMGT